ncbi:MAG: Rne/Rng family ribonuclease, partial [Rhodovarius sp.]|nr:Rne/Rng family ribonuclease [Rhodovarius sp.]
MTKRMLIDASHAEETRVAVLDGSRLEEFDLEFANKLPLKGNIYLAKVVRVEPSLQAAFVEYGGNRHGFLAFGEIHPDYYQIPVADREKLLAMQEAEAREAAEEEERAAARAAARARKLALAEQRRRAEAAADSAAAEAETASPEAETAPAEGMEGSGQSMPAEGSEGSDQTAPAAATAEEAAAPPAGATDEEAAPALAEPAPAPAEPAPPQPAAEAALSPEAAPPSAEEASPAAVPAAPAEEMEAQSHIVSVDQEMPPPETLGGAGAELSAGEEEGLLAGDGAAEEEASDAEFGAVEEDEEDLAEERIGRRVPPRFLRNYKIQEVIKRRQIMLVQVVKEERGGKGAALTTYISLAGRFSVLMPNTPRGGGVSRKITSLADRRRLREVIDELDLPPGMSLIIRTAGAQRPKAEIRRDCEALLRLWDSIRERTLASVAPALIYQEADLIKRAIRDGYARDVDEILVEGEEAYNQVRDVMRMLMPEAVRKVQLYRDGPMPLFARYGVEQQLEAMHNQVVPLKSGGTIVIHQTEALVAIDVNSGRSTRERNIEDTALRTNLEAAEEIARQLRLRDLAGLIVIDFIDMESPKNNAAVEKRLKEALKNDRARIQVGRISHFGLLEMSRQRLRPSLMEQTFQTCPHCQGRGVVRSPESAAIQVLRALEEEGAKRRAAEVLVHVRPEVAMYLLNRKRDRLNQIEERFGMLMQFSVAEALPPHLTHKLERLRAADQRPAQEERSQPPAIRIDTLALPPPTEAEEDEAAEAAGEPGESEAAPLAGAQAEGQERRRRRRRRRR